MAERFALPDRQRAESDGFNDLSKEVRRLFGEVFGTFFLVVVATGGGVVDTVTHGEIGRAAVVTAPGLMVAAVILFMGTVSGAHLNPVVTIAFAARTDFEWRRVPAYIAAQTVGAILAALILRALFGTHLTGGLTLPQPGFSTGQALLMEILLTLGLVSVILGAASGAQNLGPLSAVAVGSYIVLAGLWASPVSGASMNPVRSLGPALISGNYRDLWVYLAGPLIGALLAVVAAYILRGRGGGTSGVNAAQGKL